MKRFLRYLLLAGCVMLLCVWIVSYWGGYQMIYDTYAISTYDGWIFLDDYYNLPSQALGFSEFRSPNDFFNASHPNIIFPIWIVFIPLFLLTVRLWYHPLKAWWRGTHRKGFEVVIKDKASADGK